MKRKTITVGLALLASAVVGYAARGAAPVPDLSTLNPAALKYVLPANIPWQVTPGLDTAILYGDPQKPGFYVLMYRWKPGNASHPHYHINDRYIMVLSGTWWVGTGTNWDLDHATAPIKPGTFVTHYAKQVHYDGARTDSTEPAVELVWGQGPATTVVCDGANAEKGPGPCEDARQAAAKR
jgi:hypothetical protein